ncbi:MAG: hypothetical protein ACRELF_19150, partial [Gemmataceae bacterium]
MRVEVEERSEGVKGGLVLEGAIDGNFQGLAEPLEEWAVLHGAMEGDQCGEPLLDFAGGLGGKVIPRRVAMPG